MRSPYDAERIQGSQVLFCETILLIAPLMEIHAVAIVTTAPTQESYAIFRCSITGSHDLVTAAGRGCSINGGDCACSVFSPVIRDIQADDRSFASWRRPFNNEDVGYLAVLAKEFIRTESRN
jgi:hypothetical protein